MDEEEDYESGNVTKGGRNSPEDSKSDTQQHSLT